MSTFEGIPEAAIEFYARLEENNNRPWWLEHKVTYDTAVREPLTLLMDALEPAFGPSKIFRPNRDMRFSADKSPYKTAQGAFVSNHEGVGFYVQVSADGLLLGGGYHSSAPAQLARFRTAVDAPVSGEALVHIVAGLQEVGFSIEGEKLKTAPRGFAKEHPRAELLTHKTLHAGLLLGRPDWLDTAGAQHEIAARWDQLRPLVDWVVRYAAP